jgi:hypothetical protein
MKQTNRRNEDVQGMQRQTIRVGVRLFFKFLNQLCRNPLEDANSSRPFRQKESPAVPRSLGRTKALSLPRRFIADLLWASHGVEAVTFERRMNLAPLVAARQESAARPGWCAIFTKAFGLVCARRAELRCSYLSYPWPRLHESASNVAAVAVERRLDGEEAVLIAHLRDPERRSLTEIEAWLRQCRHAPAEQIGSFRRILQITRLPRPLRRLFWLLALNWGRHRCRFLGTFGVSVTAGLGATALGVRCPLTTILHYGIFDDDGHIDVRLTFDHRVLDGGNVARALCDLEDVLCGEILAELEKSASVPSLT